MHHKQGYTKDLKTFLFTNENYLMEIFNCAMAFIELTFAILCNMHTNIYRSYTELYKRQKTGYFFDN